MSGIQMAMLGAAGNPNTSIVMTTGTTTVVIKGTTYYTGYMGAGSLSSGVPGVIGSMTNAVFNGLPINAVFWSSGTSANTNGTNFIELPGSRTSGYITSVTSNSTSLGTIGTYTYNSGANVTTIQLGGSGTSNNVFGANGDIRIIVVT